jgi:hypothetical protein
MVVFVVLAAAAAGTLIGGGSPANSAKPSGSDVALGSSSPSTPAGSISASASPGATSSDQPSASPTGSASPSPTAPPAPPATVTFTQLKLDARGATGDRARFITFTTDGPGTVTAKLTSDSPQGTTHMTLRVGSTDVQTKDWAKGTMTAKTSGAHANWRVTLEGNGIDTPTVELTITFPSLKPSVKITHADFNGTSDGGYNGIQVRFAPRAAGNATLTADWGGHPFLYEIDLLNETSSTGSKTLANQGPATNTSNSFPVTAKDSWKLLLQNIETGNGVTDLTATVGWP